MFQISSCPTCESKGIKRIRRKWIGKYRGQAYSAPDLKYFECPICGEKIYDRDAMWKIEAHFPALSKAIMKK
jgi:YgiT-type zinc finger domain-containing protein